MKNLIKKGKKQGKSSKVKAEVGYIFSGQPITDSELLEKEMMSSKEEVFLNVYQSCQELPLNRFIQIVCEDRFDLLIKEGEEDGAPLAYVLKKWFEIYTQYSELVDERFIFSLRGKLDIETLKAKIMAVGISVELLGREYDEDLVQVLRDHGFDFAYDQDNLIPDLNKVITLSKSWITELNLMEQDISQAGESKKPTEDQFDEVLEVLSKEAGYAIRAYDLTVYQYATRVKRFVKRMQKQKQDERKRS